ncbi:hypothetical protein GOP47_0022580 [Adiantum capillus-veneris]|uniref:tRNA (guanine(26)-N(2))-dimethyltransferase n=1 Tax=Adiantum capillus-veneris TaxID=13818 RepID=A0A9D4U804_ADICA|nr:hypothetical protein GOP47_0022580 [Adiantum capillus-veneris]
MEEESAQHMRSKGSKLNSNKKDKSSSSSEYSILKEGRAEILLRGNDVFYNKAQIVNRDLSIAVVKAFLSKREEEFINGRNKKRSGAQSQAQPEEKEKVESSCGSAPSDSMDSKTQDIKSDAILPVKPLRVLEALAASGLRALRYAREIDGVGSVIALDNDEVAVESCKRNIKLNGSVAAAKVQPVHADARVYMLTHEKEFDAVDVDPYGSPSVFLDSAVQTVADGGLLMCTATDMAVLCGNNGEVCYSKYGAYPLRGKYCHEMALRILLASIESHANRYKRYIIPVLSVSIDFYVRVFVRIYTSPKAVKASASKLSYLYQCVGCDAFHLQPVGRIVYRDDNARYLPGTGPVILPECKHCGKRFNMGGAIWSEPIHDADWIALILKEMNASRKSYPAFDKVHGVVTAISEELLDAPLYLSLHSLCSTLKCTSPSASLFRYAVVNAGYNISSSHASPLGLKTNAPMDVVWDIMRCWVKTHPVKAQTPDHAGTKILSQEPVLQANFSKVNAALSKARTKGIPRFVPNPEEYWGPKPRAGRQLSSKHMHSHGLTGPSPNGASHVEAGAAPQEVSAEEKVADAELEPESKRQKVDSCEAS